MTRPQINERLAHCRSCAQYPACTHSQKLADSKTVCPLDPPKWKEPTLMDSVSTKQYGDAVAIIAQPIAKVIDSVAGTNIKNCWACAKRQEAWNLKV